MTVALCIHTQESVTATTTVRSLIVITYAYN